MDKAGGPPAGEYSRRGLLWSGALGLGALVTGCSGTGRTATTGSATTARPTAANPSAAPPGTPAEAWSRLRTGNARWAAGSLQHPDQTIARRKQVAPGQKPFAVVVSCIDSRLPPEIVFDQGLGDVYAIRTGAQTVDRLVTASIEYGPVESGTPLLVVLGHQRCGAVTAAVESIEKRQKLPGQLNTIVASIRPAYEVAHTRGGDIIDQTVRAQTLRTVNGLTADPPLAARIRQGTLGVVAAYYSLETGQVSVLKTVGFDPA